MTSRWPSAFALAALLFCASAELCASDETVLPDLRCTEAYVDLGCIAVDFKFYHTFHLVNHGQDTIYIDTVTGHCDCTTVRFRDSTVAPGDTARFLMIFNTANQYGPIDKDIRIHSTDKKAPIQEIHYLANVGQWLFKIEPRPVSVFFLPNQKVKTSILFSHALDGISVKDVTLDSNYVNVRTIKGEADKGEGLEFEVTPAPGLKPGTHLTNFTITLNLPQNAPPHRITIPVKVARY
jgi:hypothetical protein